MDLLTIDAIMSDSDSFTLIEMLRLLDSRRKLYFKIRESLYTNNIEHTQWLDSYNELQFFKLFRMQKSTFYKLLEEIIANDQTNLIKKKYRGGNYPIQPEKSLLAFLWYISKQDTLISIGDRFGLAVSSVMNIVNVILYLLIRLKKKYIFWPKTEEEYERIINGFPQYPSKFTFVLY